MSWWEKLDGRHRRIVIAAAVGAVVFAFVGGRWPVAAGAIFAGLAMVAAVVAVVFAFPSYFDWASEQSRKPAMNAWLAVGPYFGMNRPDLAVAPARVEDEIEIDYPIFLVRAVVENTGTGSLQGGILNLIVPALCRIETLDPVEKRHYASPFPSSNSEITGDAGETIDVRFSVAERTFTPGHHIYHLKVVSSVKPGEAKDVPVLIVVEGDMSEPVTKRIVVMVNMTAKRRKELPTLRPPHEE